MSGFIKAFLVGLKGIVEAGNDLDRLKFLPQRIEEGHIINFNGKSLIGKVEGLEDSIIFDADEVLTKKRLTGAFITKYMNELDKNLINLLEEDDISDDEPETKKEDELLASLLDFAKEGDKRGARTVLKEVKAKWFALEDDIVEDAIEDIKDAIGDKDIEGVKEIYLNTEGDEEDVDSRGNTNTSNDDISDTKPLQQEEKKVAKSFDEQLEDLAADEKDEDVNSLLLDLADAIKDDDKEDVKDILLPELDSKHPAVKIVNAYLGNTPSTEEDTHPAKEVDDEMSDEEWIEEWKVDIDEAIDTDELEKAKSLLEEFKEEFGEDEPEYKEYSEKLTPKEEPKTRTRRRGRK